jgi:hypothetical protein
LRIEGEHRVMPPVEMADDTNRQDRLKDKGQARHQDIVEISETAKHLHAETTDRVSGSGSRSDVEGSLPQIMTAIRERIRTGFYDSEEVLGQIARRIVDLRDL